MTDGITIEGLDTLKINLEKVDQAVSGPGLLRSLAAGGFVLEGEAKRIANQKEILDTGFLIGTIQAQPPRRNAKGGEVEVVSGAEYSVYNEFGTSKMAARPYMRPAVKEGKNKIQNAVSRQLKNEINKAI